MKPLAYYLARVRGLVDGTCRQYDPEKCISYDNDVNELSPCLDIGGVV